MFYIFPSEIGRVCRGTRSEHGQTPQRRGMNFPPVRRSVVFAGTPGTAFPTACCVVPVVSVGNGLCAVPSHRSQIRLLPTPKVRQDPFCLLDKWALPG